MKIKFLPVFFMVILIMPDADAQMVKIGTQESKHKVIVREFIDTLITKDTVNGYEEIMIMKSSGLYLKLADCASLTGSFDLGSSGVDLQILKNVSNIQTYCMPKQDPLNWKIAHMQMTLERNGNDPLTFHESEMQFSHALQAELDKLNVGDRVVVKNLQLTGPGGKTCTFSFSLTAQ